MSATVGHELHQNRLTFQAKLARLGSGKIHCCQIIAINSNGRYAKGNTSCSNAIPSILFRCRCGDCPSIVSANEEGLRTQGGCKIECYGAISLRCSPFTKEGHCDTWFRSRAECITSTHCLWNLGSKRRADCLHPNAGITVMNWHLSPLSRLITAAEALVNYLLDAKASMKVGAKLSILGPNHISSSQLGSSTNLCSLLTRASHVEGDPTLAL
mmetsp:Transcript_10705/g.23557  ORF Transcript_10705/g.23557 Transcript_10705/m.23557 type:complete len:213 (-) Transcript_10705:349-987(-)